MHTPDLEFILDESTNIKDKIPLGKRSRRKYFSWRFVLPLIDLNSPLTKSYWNTFYCCNTLIREGEKVTATWTRNEEGNLMSPYCKNRWCLVCSSIRTAVLINTYKPILESWDDKHFVTLTVPNMPTGDLAGAIDGIQREFRKIKHMMKIRNGRGKGDKFVGFRKLECTYNHDRDDFHPHYHVIVRGEGAACELLNEWLRRFPEARKIAQDVRKADDDSVMELFKYFTKLTAKINGKYGVPKIEALDMMFQTMRGRRTFQNFGFNTPRVEKEEISEEVKEVAKEIEKETVREVYVWAQEYHDWVCKETGELLTGYEPTERWRELVEGIGKEVCHG